MKLLTAHLDEVGETYFQHFGHAVYFAVAMVVGGIACFVHAVFPFLFQKTGSQSIEALYDKMVVNRKNLTPSPRRSTSVLHPTRESLD